MENEIQQADPRLRRVTAIVLVLSVILAGAFVLMFRHWLADFATTVPTEDLVAHLRPWLGAAVVACSACVLVLAGCAAVVARGAAAEKRWPVRRARVLRNTVVRNGEQALRIARLLNLVALVLGAIGVAALVLAWRLFTV